MQVRAGLHPIYQRLLEKPVRCRSAKALNRGPVHVVVPEILDENIARFRAIFDEFNLVSNINLALKSCGATSIARQAKRCGIDIDVASEGELKEALACGFTGKNISCTGPKNRAFLFLAVHHGALISIDSLSELYELKNLASQLKEGQLPALRVLVRLTGLEHAERQMLPKVSRFGVLPSDLNEIFTFFKEQLNFVLEGFHFHADGYDAETRAGFLDHMLRITLDSFREGFSPSVVNIGGSWRCGDATTYRDWSAFVEKTQSALKEGAELPFIGPDFYGMRLGERGAVQGLEGALQKVYKRDFESDLREILSTTSLLGQSVAQTLKDSLLTLAVEPGFALTSNTAVSIVEVVGEKLTSGGQRLLLADANRYNLGVANLFEYVVDPIPICEDSSSETANKPFEGFLAGNLCYEDDLLMRRKLYLPRTPKAGDLLCFPNTGAYHAHFEDAEPIKQPKGRFVAMQEISGAVQFIDDDNYYPWVSDVG